MIVILNSVIGIDVQYIAHSSQHAVMSKCVCVQLLFVQDVC
jgi:hypothetical protein